MAVTLRPQTLALLEPSRNVNYGQEALISERDGEIRDLLLKVADSAPFEDVAVFVPRAGERVLTVFAERAASIAVRHQDARELRAGIFAVVLAQAITDDPRVLLPAVALLHRAAEMIGEDPAAEFHAANELTGGRAGGLLDFLRRSPEDKSIKSMGFEEGNDKQDRQFRFLRDW